MMNKSWCWYIIKAWKNSGTMLYKYTLWIDPQFWHLSWMGQPTSLWVAKDPMLLNVGSELLSDCGDARLRLQWSHISETHMFTSSFQQKSNIWATAQKTTNKMTCAPSEDLDQPGHPRNDITTLASYDRRGSDSILSPQCNSWRVIHFPTRNMGLQGLLLNILQ